MIFKGKTQKEFPVGIYTKKYGVDVNNRKRISREGTKRCLGGGGQKMLN